MQKPSGNTIGGGVEMKKNSKHSTKRNTKKRSNTNLFYVALYSSLGIVAIVGGIVTANNIQRSREPLDMSVRQNATQQNSIDHTLSTDFTDTQIPLDDITAFGAANTPMPNSPDAEEQTTATQSSPQETPAPAAEASVFVAFTDNEKMDWPVIGQVVMDYSPTQAIFDVTLEQYRTNHSISIAAPVGTQVRATTAGKVTDVFTDFRNGTTVVLDNGNGWSTTYSQLQEHVLVSVGDIIPRGHVIGGVGEPTMFRILLGGHLDFSVARNDNSVNPMTVLVALD